MVTSIYISITVFGYRYNTIKYKCILYSVLDIVVDIILTMR